MGVITKHLSIRGGGGVEIKILKANGKKKGCP